MLIKNLSCQDVFFNERKTVKINLNILKQNEHFSKKVLQKVRMLYKW